MVKIGGGGKTMSKKIYNPLISVGIQDFFDPKNDIKEAVNTDAVIMKDTSGNKKWSIKHNTNIVKYDHYSPEPDNKIVNSGFETDLSSWTSVLSYTLNDQFTTDRAAGAVNGTSAEPTGGTRTVTDTNGKLSITGGALSTATGGVGDGNPGIWYPLVTRAAGKIMVAEINRSTNGYQYAGFDVNATGAVTGNSIQFYDTSMRAYDSVGGAPFIDTVASGTLYKLAIVTRTAGAYYFVKGGVFTNWTLVYIHSGNNTASLYPAITNSTSANNPFTADNIRIPTSTWLPTTGVIYATFT